MKKSKLIIIAIIAMLIFGITAILIANRKKEYVMAEGIEYHFYPEEYDEQYSRIEDSFDLSNKEKYQMEVQASCKDGTMQIKLTSGDIINEYTINAETPCDEIVDIPNDKADKIYIFISIEKDTEGDFIGTLLKMK